MIVLAMVIVLVATIAAGESRRHLAIVGTILMKLVVIVIIVTMNVESLPNAIINIENLMNVESLQIVINTNHPNGVALASNVVAASHAITVEGNMTDASSIRRIPIRMVDRQKSHRPPRKMRVFIYLYDNRILELTDSWACVMSILILVY